MLPGAYDTHDSYWSVDGHVTYSKLDALSRCQGNVGRVKYHWMENTWDHVDFSRDPIQDWDTLCRARAQQIRDTHKWVCLWYSGGYDSAHILETFIQAQLPIDEIVVFDQTSYFDDGEVGVALKTAQKYKDTHNAQVVINQLDIGWGFIQEQFKKNNWIDQPGDNTRFTRSYWGARRDHALINNPITDRADVVGHEKPRLDIYQGQWRTFMPDSLVGLTSGSGITQFYTSHQFPELHVKQVHMAIDFFENKKINTPELIHKFQSFTFGDNSFYQLSGPIKSYYLDWNLALGRRLPIHMASILGSQKSSAVHTDVTAPKDRKILLHAKQSESLAFDKYQEGINDLNSIFKDWRPWSTTDGQKKLPTICSKFYAVEPVKSTT